MTSIFDFFETYYQATKWRNTASPDASSFYAIRELLKRENICAGLSTGTALYAALEHCRRQTEPKRVVTFVYDDGKKYLSKVYNDTWMKEHGFIAN